MKNRLKLPLIAITALAMTFSFAGCADKERPDNSSYTVNISTVQSVAYDSQTEMLEKIRPTVVDIRSLSDNATSSGSGVIIANSGDQYFIVTNHHVIEGGKVFYVEALDIDADDQESTTAYEAMLIGSSLTRDIAVLSVYSSKKLSVASFIKDSDTVKVGTEVFAIGNPLGLLGGTVTHGIVSATKRKVSVGNIGTMTLMQTDANINGGNSGGGLFDANGVLIGIINSGYETYNGQSVEGLNFAIPANDANYAVTKLIETHKEENGEVTQYGYVEGDARMDISYSVATLRDGSAVSSSKTYLVMNATSMQSPFYADWRGNLKAVVSITVNNVKTSLAFSSGQSVYTLTTALDNVISSIKVGDVVTVEYKDILISSFKITYVDATVKTTTFTAQQYSYSI